MIKITKDGIKPKKYKKIYSLTCETCHCEFEFEESDCSRVRHEKRIDGEYRGEIDCPCCKEGLFIDFKTAVYKEEIVEEEESKVVIPIASHRVLDICPKCGGILVYEEDMVLTSYPPKYSRICGKCGHRWYTQNSESISINPFDNVKCNYCSNKDKITDACGVCPDYPYKITYSSDPKYTLTYNMNGLWDSTTAKSFWNVDGNNYTYTYTIIDSKDENNG